IVFTEYRDTLDHVRRSLPLPTAVVHGGLGRSERREAVRAFGKGAARVLLATDAAGEGLNLQEGCRIVINLELPWNPNRLEQRIGRVDRIGQRHTVHAFHLIAAGVGEEGILTSLQQRLTRARHDIAVADPLATTMPEASDTAAVWTEPSSRVFPVIDPSSEFSRLSLLRALPRANGHENLAGPSGPAIVLASRRLRARLRGALLAVVSSTLENSVGLRVAHRVSAVVLDCRTAMRRRLDHQQVDRLVANIERHFLRFDPDAGMWRERSRHTHLDLLTRRLAREREIEAAAARHAGALQAGLFDRRAERAADAAADQERLRREQSALRLAQLHRSMQLNDMISRVALILVP
ncbi:MAG: C-terminal helicase domain-containing protein, partial [Vicinamibacterales bacterium]